jgi:hypothetical protein
MLKCKFSTKKTGLTPLKRSGLNAQQLVLPLSEVEQHQNGLELPLSESGQHQNRRELPLSKMGSIKTGMNYLCPKWDNSP